MGRPSGGKAGGGRRGAGTVRGAGLKARYDAAEHARTMAAYWAAADAKSADAAMNPSVRKVLRERARYERANNSYAAGIVRTLANDMVGTGPRLQCTGGDAEANRQVEARWHEWFAAAGLCEVLRLMREARAESGEAFGLLVNNPALDNPVKLALRLVESDRVCSDDLLPDRSPNGQTNVDGVVFDRHGNVVEYHVSKQHPGSDTLLGLTAAHDTVPASSMVHYFVASRPEQHRGVPDIAPALMLFGQLRRYTHATVEAAESAAAIGGVLQTNTPAGGDAEDLEPLDEIDMPAKTMIVAPGGWEYRQVDAKQPTTTYPDFKRELLNEIARCLNMPYNVAAGNSSSYNYASGRLDHQTYHKAIRVDRHHFAQVVLTPILRAWFAEAVLIPGYLPESVRRSRQLPPHKWMYDGHEHVDPVKEANAQKTRLENNTTTLAEEYASQGKDWEAELRQRAIERKLERKLGLVAEGGEAPEDPDDEQGESDEE